MASANHKPIAYSTVEDAFGVLDTSDGKDLSAELPRARRWLDSRVVTSIYDAIANRRQMKIRYTSMSSGETDPQWVAPTRFTFDGETIHFRAYSFKRNDYRNFHPARIELEDEYESTEIELPLPFDKEWNTLSVIWLRPSAGLSASQAAVVRREFGFSDDLLRIEVRQALEFYLDSRWGLNEEGARLERVRTEHLPLEPSRDV